MHVFLSPHLDDVVVSCGATIAQLKQQGEHVVILTVMAGEPPDELPDTPVIRALREQFEGVNKAVITQRTEHTQAAMCLGVQVYHLAVLECCYRTATSVDGPLALYPSSESQHGDVHPADDARVALLATPLPFKQVRCLYAPLGVGNHVDHQLVRDWALLLGGHHGAPRLKFYGEYPELLQREALEQALDFLRRTLPGLKLHAETTVFDDEAIRLKFMALRCYVSQSGTRWETMDTMEQVVRRWMEATGDGSPAERFWNLLRETGELRAPWE